MRSRTSIYLTGIEPIRMPPLSHQTSSTLSRWQDSNLRNSPGPKPGGVPDSPTSRLCRLLITSPPLSAGEDSETIYFLRSIPDSNRHHTPWQGGIVTIQPMDLLRIWRDSNPRSPPWQGGMLGHYTTHPFCGHTRTRTRILPNARGHSNHRRFSSN